MKGNIGFGEIADFCRLILTVVDIKEREDVSSPPAVMTLLSLQ